ncbi:hypothetical protein CVT26_013956 [Gymnopilus dilepis]|uniref:Cytochrome P450 n=1 Tax=Gymnopilus dilepis TaxID=231916 RepID=A0A409WDT0_9AGAR|nr:hypothetical protein CVT26_013956 [Gymnopilus dilepis]
MLSSYAFSDLLRISIFTGILVLLLSFAQRFLRRKQSTGTQLLGPPNPSFLFGHLRLLIKAPNGRGEIYEQWAKTYGPAYSVAGPLGSTRVVICDPRALAHYYSKETFTYVQSKFTKVLMANIFGRGLLYAEGESHRRQRKALSPAFSNASIRKLTHVFYDSVYKAKAHWDSIIQATPASDALIDVSEWMDHIALDSIGKAAFGHDFESLDGKSKSIAKDLHTLGTSSNGVVGQVIFILSAIFPSLLHLPTKQNLMIRRLRANMGRIADELLERNRQELDVTWVVMLLADFISVKAETNGGSLAMSREEILSQVFTLFRERGQNLNTNTIYRCMTQIVYATPGYATTSGSLTWALIELCRHPEVQQKLREELLQEAGNDPTFDQLSAGFPYLDAVAQEVLRLHPAVISTTRVAAEDDIIPFSRPIKIASGEQVFSLVVKKGDTITSPIDCVNTSDAFWGPNSKIFEPERWLDPNGLTGAKDLAGYRHILTFSDGPRMCLGRHFALTEFKAVLFVLIRNYSFELRDGPDTKIESLSSFARRPKIAGEKEPRVLMKFLLPLVLTSLLLVLVPFARRLLNGSRTNATKLLGPPNPSLIFGALPMILKAPGHASDLYNTWIQTYGPAFRVPGPMGSSRIMIFDPRAITHFYSKETFTYVQTKFTKIFVANIFGRGLLYAEGESHRRQRKALSPAFSNAAIRKLTHVFYDAAHKVKANWDSTLDGASGEAMIDVQAWMNHISLDSIGIAGFGHDFQSLDGQSSTVVDVFDSFASASDSLVGRILFLLSPVFPWLQHFPTRQNRLIKKMRATMERIGDEVLARNKAEFDGKPIAPEDKSIIGLLGECPPSLKRIKFSFRFPAKAELGGTSLAMTREEVVAQWALIELCRKPEKQQRLRDELLQAGSSDPTYDRLWSGLPYLDAVAHEILRLHPPVGQTTRVATEDDVIPFSEPVKTASGEEVTSIVVKKGDTVTVSIGYTNRSETFWGPNAKEFEPERWLDPEGLARAKDIQGHRHILTFSDGPRICLGRNFALVEFKAVLAVLIRSFSFELPHGPDTEIETHPAIFRRPKNAGEKEPRLILRVKRLE